MANDQDFVQAPRSTASQNATVTPNNSAPANNGSIVDYLNSTGGNSSFANRAVLAQKYGISNYTGSADQNTALLGKLQSGGNPPAQPTQNSVVSPDTAHAFINGGQTNDFNDATKSGDVPVRASAQSYQDLYNSLVKTLTPTSPAPTIPNLTDTYNGLRTSYGVTDLESQLNTLQSQAKQVTASLALQKTDEEGKPVAMNVIEGRESEETKQANQKLTEINNQISTLSGQLQTKYNTIDTLMKYTSQDYTNASAAYDKQFSNNIQLFNTVKGVQDSTLSQDEKAKDDARANLQIIYNTLTSGGGSLSTISDAEKANITKLELQAGLPQGFYQALVNKNPKADILSTTTRDNNGTKYADVIMRNQDGSLSTKTITLGGVSSAKNDGTFGELTSADKTKGLNWILTNGGTKDDQAKFQTDRAFQAWVMNQL